jgi:uncharacterized protein YdhG (YjbR/CyaY superfamily)
MQYDVKTPDEYLNALENDWRKEKLLEVRDLLQKNGQELKEGIQYKMLSYEYEGHLIFSLNAQRNYVSLYVGNVDKVEDAREELQEFNIGKGCIRIKKSLDLKATKLDKFIGRTMDIHRQGGDTDC